MKTLTGIIFVLGVFFGLSSFVSAQKSVVVTKNENWAAMQVEDVEIKGQGVRQLLSKIASTYEVPIGLEIAQSEDELIIHNFYFKKGTLSDLLTQFVNEHNQYTWEIKDDVVNVFPKDGYRDLLLKELLEVELSTFSIKKETSCRKLGMSLVDTPAIKQFLEDNEITHRQQDISGFYFMQLGRDFTLDITNMKLKAILNKVAKDSQIAKFWLVRRDSYDQSISINFVARHEDSPFRRMKSNISEIDF